MEPIRTAIIDRQPLYRAGVRATLEAAEGFVTPLEGASLEDAVALAAAAPSGLVTLIDLALIEARETLPSALGGRVIGIDGGADEVGAQARAAALGCAGWAPRHVEAGALVERVRAAAAGRAVRGDRGAAFGVGAPVEPDRLGALSARERAVLQGVAMGRTNREIAEGLALREKTVKHYMTSIFQKIDARNRVEAVLIYRGVAVGLDRAAGAPPVLHR